MRYLRQKEKKIKEKTVGCAAVAFLAKAAYAVWDGFVSKVNGGRIKKGKGTPKKGFSLRIKKEWYVLPIRNLSVD